MREKKPANMWNVNIPIAITTKSVWVCVCVCVCKDVFVTLFFLCKKGREKNSSNNTHTLRQQIHAKREDFLSLPFEYIRFDFKVKIFECICFGYGNIMYIVYTCSYILYKRATRFMCSIYTHILMESLWWRANRMEHMIRG